MDKIRQISDAFERHYGEKIREHGATARGLDWGAQADVDLRYAKMLEVIRPNESGEAPSLLDVGCGYGGLLSYARQQGVACRYTGIDIVAESIELARVAHPDGDFLAGDLLEWDFAGRRFDYVVCSGILTLKLTSSILDMHRYFQRLVRTMYALCDQGTCFNTMTNCVNYTADKLYYRSPVEVLSFCLSELSTKVRLDQAYALYEFTTYVYRYGQTKSP